MLKRTNSFLLETFSSQEQVEEKKNILGFLSRTRFPALINGDIAALRSDWFASFSASVVIEGLVSGFPCFALTACIGLVFDWLM